MLRRGGPWSFYLPGSKVLCQTSVGTFSHVWVSFIWLWLSKRMGSHFGVGEFTTHFRQFWWGLGCSLGVWAFDPWPFVTGKEFNYLKVESAKSGQEP